MTAIINIMTISLVGIFFLSAYATQTTPRTVSNAANEWNLGDRPASNPYKYNETDAYITQNIRRDLMADKQLSLSAKNVQIITIDGRVTLRGAVRSRKEAAKVLKSAYRAAGEKNVLDEMTVK